MLKKIKNMLVAPKKQEKRPSMFGDISIEEEEKIWKRITKKATEDQEETMRKADELIKEREKNGISSEEEIRRQKFVFTKPTTMTNIMDTPLKSNSIHTLYENTNNSSHTAER